LTVSKTIVMPIACAAMATCVTCQKPLTLYIEPEDDDEDERMVSGSSANAGSYVDDDVEMQCGCHFHWSVFRCHISRGLQAHMLTGCCRRQCLLDAYSMTECPNCQRNLNTTTETGEQQLLCNLKNEGGVQERLDILPILMEESYLRTYPEERRSRAFLEFCGEGDVEAVVDLLNSDEHEEDEEDEHSGETTIERDMDVLRHQDQVGSMGSGLHIAIQNGREEMAWLLLFLASDLEIDRFPKEVLQAAQRLGIWREDRKGKTDIRTLKDSNGHTAESIAYSVQGPWHDWLQSGRLKPPET